MGQDLSACSKHLHFVLRELETAGEKVSEQIESICQQCSWLSDVSEFIRSWKGSEWEYNMLADEFEVKKMSSYYYTVSHCVGVTTPFRSH